MPVLNLLKVCKMIADRREIVLKVFTVSKNHNGKLQKIHSRNNLQQICNNLAAVSLEKGL